MSHRNNLVNWVLQGEYDSSPIYFHFSDIRSFADWIFQEIVLEGLGERDFYEEWVRVPKDPKEQYFYNLLYFAVSRFEDNVNWNSVTERQKRSMKLYVRDILKFIATKQPAKPIDQGGVQYWKRLGQSHWQLGEREEAIETLNEGISWLKRTTQWKSGMLIGFETTIQNKYSVIEILYAQRAQYEYEMGRKEEAAKSADIALQSIHIRGHEDMINQSFPNGIKHLL